MLIFEVPLDSSKKVGRKSNIVNIFLVIECVNARKMSHYFTKTLLEKRAIKNLRWKSPGHSFDKITFSGSFPLLGSRRTFY